MELRALRLFVEVVRQGGFSRAGKAVFATQSTVSKAVRQLEDETGLPLLERLGTGVRLTGAGEIVYRRAVRLLAEREDLASELAEFAGLKRGLLRLGLPPIGSAALFAPLVAAYRARHPEIDIRLVEHGSDRLTRMLEAGEVDFAGLLLPMAPQFHWHRVRRERLSALLTASHPLAGAPRLGLPELRATPFILFETGFTLNRIILEACQRQGFQPEVIVRSSQIDFIIELAAAGMGVAFLPDSIAAAAPAPHLARVPLDEPEADWDMAMAWRAGAYLSPAAEAWLAVLRAAHPDTAGAARN